MNTLPVCNIAEHPAKQFMISTSEEYESFLNEIESYIDGNCFAFKVDDELIFNAYDNNRTFKEILTDRSHLSEIRNDIHTGILVYIHKRDVNAKIEIYMNKFSDAYKIMVLYEANQRKYTVQRYNTAEYVSRLGLEVEF
jgi:hypothetical protein